MGVSSENPVSITEASKLLRARLCNQCLPPEIKGYENERSQLLDLVRRTAKLSESNSMLMIGSRGSGKTMLLRSVLEELRHDKDITDNLLEVHLNGLLQTDDKIALKEITRQLQLENTVGDRVFGSFAENLQFLLDSLKSGDKSSKSTLFVLEEFDLFAHHKNQTLLYNLFDISQSAQAPICVLGITSRLDVIELLEKRVKSRFSHRQLHLLPTLNFDDYVDVFVSTLSLPADFGDKKYVKEWNKRVQSLSKEGSIQDLLRNRYQGNKDIKHLQTLLMLPVCRINPDHPYLEARDFMDSSKHLKTDAKAAMLHGVSVLELSLIIAMKHLTETYDGQPFNFEMVFNEYQKFAQKKSQMQLFDKAVVMKAFEHLCALELVSQTESGGGGSQTQKEYRMLMLQVDNSQIMEALQRFQGCPTEVKQWATAPLHR